MTHLMMMMITHPGRSDMKVIIDMPNKKMNDLAKKKIIEGIIRSGKQANSVQFEDIKEIKSKKEKN